ncbi:uncharacterized protein LOC110708939 [Chenopodium quinoa]|uniref:uncharacterized protein LOC110708939 n=1 Tax=Chenopodium quinoa TaxID=63459 RepID=UPI000B776C8C|nr:uncharacterized protein LOC110708939 [Chenopodium quinoa]
MEDELIDKCSSLKLEDDEENVIDLGNMESGKAEGNLELLVVGRLCMARPYNVEAFKRTMLKVWAPVEGMVIRVLSPNLYGFQFFHWRDKEKVMKGRPWCWDNHLLVLNEVGGDEQPDLVNLKHSPFWLRIFKLPFNCRSNEYIEALVSGLGELLEIEEDTLGLNRYRRVRLMLDVTRPLRRYQRIKSRGGNEFKVEFKYE